MYAILLGFALVFAVAGLLHYFGTNFHIFKSGIFFGLRKYPFSHLSEYNFVVSKETGIAPSTAETTSWVIKTKTEKRKILFFGDPGIPAIIIKVDVYQNGALLRTHIFTRSHEIAACKLIAKINQGIKDSQKQL